MWYIKLKYFFDMICCVFISWYIFLKYHDISVWYIIPLYHTDISKYITLIYHKKPHRYIIIYHTDISWYIGAYLSQSVSLLLKRKIIKFFSDQVWLGDQMVIHRRRYIMIYRCDLLKYIGVIYYNISVWYNGIIPIYHDISKKYIILIYHNIFLK